jgi:hypothetical protein
LAPSSDDRFPYEKHFAVVTTLANTDRFKENIILKKRMISYDFDYSIIDSVELLREFKDRIHWDKIDYNLIDSVELLREFKDYFDCNQIDYHLIDSVELLREFKDHLNWSKIDYRLIDSDCLLIEFKKYLNWCLVDDVFIPKMLDIVRDNFLEKRSELKKYGRTNKLFLA